MSDPEPSPEPSQSAVGSFEDLPLHPKLRAGVREMGYREPTPIQRSAIPEAVLGRDLVGSAQTGTGKTAAFLLPILERLLDQPSGRTYALVLTPTRELALQAERFLQRLGRHTLIRGIAVYGGVGMREQERALRAGTEVVIATPGRLLDHLRRGYVDFRSLRILVLDEADRMLDMGFLPDVRRILAQLPSNRQTMLFAATMPPEVVRLSRDFLRDPRMVHARAATVAAVGVSHLALPVPAHLKTDLLVELLRDQTMTSVLVFARTKRRAGRLQVQLEQRGVDATVIHGDRSQGQRIRALEGFREGTHRVLVATDIAARGVDVEGVSHVVNYDIPEEPMIYVHRVGRTARAQRRGDAFSLVAPEESDDFHRIERHLGMEIPETRIPGFAYDAPAPAGAAARREGRGFPRRGAPRDAGPARFSRSPEGRRRRPGNRSRYGPPRREHPSRR